MFASIEINYHFSERNFSVIFLGYFDINDFIGGGLFKLYPVKLG